MKIPQLSILVPVLNERQQLPELIANLEKQADVDCELLICDGGSTDGSLEWLQQLQSALPLRILHSPPGRGRQMNLAAEQANGEWLLFLHVDSRFSDPLALSKGLSILQQSFSKQLAGHFSLKFRRSTAEPSASYYYYEWKARLGRPETIHGDQGFLLQRDFFFQLGRYREDLPVMEDTDFAERLSEIGRWQLLPAELSTSARRFEVEGLWQRQLLGALIMCFRDIGFTEFFDAAPDVYRQQSKTGKLRIRPFFCLIRQLFAELNWRDRWRVWRRSGAYVRKHAWQLSFAIDARRAFRNGLPVGQGQPLFTRWFEPVYDLLTDNPVGRLLATLLLYLWFLCTGVWLRTQEKT
ncbi:MAG TPA: TIGR04283 family arsenosugar biosynthesis glycosyltransferase [Malonomonas sp.]